MRRLKSQGQALRCGDQALTVGPAGSDCLPECGVFTCDGLADCTVCPATLTVSVAGAQLQTVPLSDGTGNMIVYEMPNGMVTKICCIATGMDPCGGPLGQGGGSGLLYVSGRLEPDFTGGGPLISGAILTGGASLRCGVDGTNPAFWLVVAAMDIRLNCPVGLGMFARVEVQPGETCPRTGQYPIFQWTVLDDCGVAELSTLIVPPSLTLS